MPEVGNSAANEYAIYLNPPENASYTAVHGRGARRQGRAIAVAARPDLEPLLASSAQIDSCLDLDRAVDRMMQPAPYPGGYTLLCKLDRNPWEKPALLLMVTLPAACGQAFCRYEIVPVFR